ncbi:MarR family transcriptional regulator [Streptomyces pilosus]|uniref:MarR family transcriptional regulator n=1 Tax=Streptomyces pilosus TaxID=28893 RepID=UPI0036412EDA
MTTTSPTVDGRAIGLAHYASRAVLEGVLARHGVTFPQSVALRFAVASGRPLGRAELAGHLAGSLKVTGADAAAVVDALIDAGLLAAGQPSSVRVTDAGLQTQERISAETGAASGRIYAGIPAADLAAAGRVLALVRERADAELAAAAGGAG